MTLDFKHSLFFKSQNIKRLGAQCYKGNRKFYELHKSCIFKLGCTFLVVLVQMICAKNYKFCKNQNANENEISQKNTKNTKKTSDQTYCHDQVFYNQPQSCHYPSLGKTSTSHLPNQKVNFDNQSSILKFSPSFNLRANQKSTPKKQCRICEDICFETVAHAGQTNTVPTHSSCSTLRKNKTNVDSGIETIVEIHDNNNSENDTFHSL